MMTLPGMPQNLYQAVFIAFMGKNRVNNRDTSEEVRTKELFVKLLQKFYMDRRILTISSPTSFVFERPPKSTVLTFFSDKFC